MKKVLHVRWGERVGGVESLLKEIARYSDKSMYEMIFCFLKTGGAHEQVIYDQGCKVSVIPARNGYDIGARLHLFKYIRDIKPDIVVEHGVPPLIRPIIRLAGSYPFITYDHGCYELYRLKKKHVSNLLIGMEFRFLSDYIITNSNYNKQTIVNKYKVASDKVDVIHPGIDTDAFLLKPDHQESKLVIGYAGRVQFSDKGVDYLVPLAQELKKSKVGNFEIRVFGDGPDLGALKETVRHALLEDVFRFLGKVSDMPEQLSKLNILVVPSKSEAFGLSPLEALSAGCNVICFDVGGLREAVGGCEQAVLVRPFDVPGMATAITEMSSGNKLSLSASLSAHDYVVKKYSAASFVSKLENYISNRMKI